MLKNNLCKQLLIKKIHNYRILKKLCIKKFKVVWRKYQKHKQNIKKLINNIPDIKYRHRNKMLC
jgi:hypothetical protein